MAQYTKDQLIQLIVNVANEWGLDPNLSVEQLRWESGNFNPIYVYGPKTSSANAMGVAQFIKATGARYGLHNTADFYNPDIEVPAWAAYMSDLLNMFGGRWDLALAGYNSGEHRAVYRQALADGQSVLNYNILAEPRKYVTNILQNAGYNSTDMPINGAGIQETPDTSGADQTVYVDDAGNTFVPDPSADPAAEPEKKTMEFRCSWLSLPQFT